MKFYHTDLLALTIIVFAYIQMNIYIYRLIYKLNYIDSM